MADFRVWGRVEQIGPQQFVAIASAVPNSLDASAMSADVRLQMRPDRERASEVLKRLMRALGKTIRKRGDRVVDVEGE